MSIFGRVRQIALGGGISIKAIDRRDGVLGDRARAGAAECASFAARSAGHGNDRVWKAWKAMKPASHPCMLRSEA
ncbi:hypothetical protein ACPOL_7221 (plasmid) [Acidisarcina polymorpha]|uniref:Uncharacterized protein n=1 Tax=Acidisarcina polymorpha TaxID=2211140 RepID=A0A2Z5GBJ5_9BACT|nr:hypothetical protein ACPOL_7221 [Acidisarcina polymorpha]